MVPNASFGTYQSIPRDHPKNWLRSYSKVPELYEVIQKLENINEKETEKEVTDMYIRLTRKEEVEEVVKIIDAAAEFIASARPP